MKSGFIQSREYGGWLITGTQGLTTMLFLCSQDVDADVCVGERSILKLILLSDSNIALIFVPVFSNWKNLNFTNCIFAFTWCITLTRFDQFRRWFFTCIPMLACVLIWSNLANVKQLTEFFRSLCTLFLLAFLVDFSGKCCKNRRWFFFWK